MTLPDTPNVSLRNAIIWIAYGKAKPLEDFAGNALWLSREKELKAARLALWSALENGRLEASAIGSDGAPTLIGKHEWQFLFGGSMRSISAVAGVSMQTRGDGLYVKNSVRKSAVLFGFVTPRFTDVTLPRDAVLSIWPPGLETGAVRVGRPSIMNEIERELDRWIAGDFELLLSQMQKHGQGGQRSITAIARALEDWSIKNGLKASLDDAPKAKAIENVLRSKLRQAAQLI
jgi:hypothetical protein